MRQDVIDRWDKGLQWPAITLSKASRDNAHQVAMCESTLKVIHFDKIPKKYSKKIGCSKVPRSNDALYITDSDDWYFVEFKNGKIDSADVYRKCYDSLLMMLDMKIVDNLSFFREKGHYILVYNGEKYGKSRPSPSREAIYAKLHHLAREEERLFGIDNFEGYLFKETHTYDKSTFEDKFIKPMEKAEQL